jgi:hypothetical protein
MSHPRAFFAGHHCDREEHQRAVPERMSSALASMGEPRWVEYGCWWHGRLADEAKPLIVSYVFGRCLLGKSRLALASQCAGFICSFTNGYKYRPVQHGSS